MQAVELFLQVESLSALDGVDLHKKGFVVGWSPARQVYAAARWKFGWSRRKCVPWLDMTLDWKIGAQL